MNQSIVRRRKAAALIAAGRDAGGGTPVKTKTDLEEILIAEIERLQRVCAEAYQFAGAVAVPAQGLDQLQAAAEGRDLPLESILPTPAAVGRATHMVTFPWGNRHSYRPQSVRHRTEYPWISRTPRSDFECRSRCLGLSGQEFL